MNAMSDLSKNVKNLFFSPEQINFNSLQKNKDLFPKSYTTKTIHFIFFNVKLGNLVDTYDTVRGYL